MGIRTHVLTTILGTVALMGASMPSAHAQWVNTGLIENGGFEADAVPDEAGYTTEITGWTWGGGGSLINDATGPFYVESSNGPIPEGTQIAGIQGEGSLSQEVSGLEDGREYRLDIHVNGRECCPAEDPAVMSVRVTLGTQTIIEVAPVTLTNPFQLIQEAFEYDEAWGNTLTIQTFDSTGDATVLFDGVALFTPFDGESVPFPPVPPGAPIAGGLGLAALAAGLAAGGVLWGRHRRTG